MLTAVAASCSLVPAATATGVTDRFSAQAEAVARSASCAPSWDEWLRFATQYVDASGRVIDHASDRRLTVSEGQSYALFFALVAGDRKAFDRVLRWTEDNLAAGSLKTRLPAWQWGRRDDGSWGVLDANSATDADLWMVYALHEAGRLWSIQRYSEIAKNLADRMLRESTTELSGLGLVLLPAPVGFGPTSTDRITRVKLNPSYLPLSVLRWAATNLKDLRWKKILASSLRILENSAHRGFAPDWVTVSSDSQDGTLTWTTAESSNQDHIGSYDAVRVYLWLGLAAPTDSSRAGLLTRFSGMAAQLAKNKEIPERVDTRSGEALGYGNPRLGWALVPYLRAIGRESESREYAARLASLPGKFPAYYEDALMLFASGHETHYYRFDVDGSLELTRNVCSKGSRSPLSRLH